MDFVNDEDLVSIPGWCIAGAFPQLSNVVYAGVRCGVDLKNIQRLSSRNFFARMADSAWSRCRSLDTVQTFSQDSCGRCLTYAPRPGKEVSVPDTIELNCILKRLDNWALANNVLEN